MLSEHPSDAKFDIGHVLFIDIRRLLQAPDRRATRLLHTLNEVVRRTDSFRAVDAAGRLARVPTGDRMALVFATTPDTAVSCAIEISDALRN